MSFSECVQFGANLITGDSEDHWPISSTAAAAAQFLGDISTADGSPFTTSLLWSFITGATSWFTVVPTKTSLHCATFSSVSVLSSNTSSSVVPFSVHRASSAGKRCESATVTEGCSLSAGGSGCFATRSTLSESEYSYSDLLTGQNTQEQCFTCDLHVCRYNVSNLVAVRVSDNFSVQNQIYFFIACGTYTN